MTTRLMVETAIDYKKIFYPDGLVEAQYLAANRRSYPAQPEVRLMAAILEDAVATLTTDLRRCTSRQRRDFAEALNWINGRTDQRSVFSFINICETLALDPDYLRQGLIRKNSENRNQIPLTETGFQRFTSPRRKTIRLRAG
jgi:hypothetical protein